MTQAELGSAIEEKQQNIANWEKSSRPPRGDVLVSLAQALGVTVDDLIHPEGVPESQPKPRPASKAMATFEEVTRLPRRQQTKILNVVDALLAQYQKEAS
ncbi:MAG: helix-turn-helix transcriptional regulator [Deltaproteobacteria bacterium]|nr:helix-turn-helix transcriptional regulator [Deltaproteobacteria bacterium]